MLELLTLLLFNDIIDVSYKRKWVIIGTNPIMDTNWLYPNGRSVPSSTDGVIDVIVWGGIIIRRGPPHTSREPWMNIQDWTNVLDE